MKIGFFAIGIANTARPEMIAALASNAERLGFATVWAPEHLLFLEKFASQYPYARGANLPVATDITLLNPFHRTQLWRPSSSCGWNIFQDSWR